MTRFAGYAAIFHRPDDGGDVIAPGAFRRSLEGRAPGDVPLLLQHRGDVVAGRIERLEEDEKGLRVIARLDGGRAGKTAGGLLKSGKLKGLSFGYRVRRAGKKGAFRRLEEVDLVEVSLVARPMQPVARVHAIEE
ncbi:HK97 family phage prohead protease [Sphingomicrobium arenosum]|uniref:HK97 family phage prohead protease n=1 Tax=Sphingomicrobium arenosum TaxID=2233861 RepID=UPI00223EDE14|nr:HK97 family phage prohead protease [Sphingomicrobium arenosum]